ncbi:MAG: ribulokinase [Clostridiales bacterium]|nr:ribulokinase [Clostridiales bacterium]
MSSKVYTIGLDFGSLSLRGVLVDAADGKVLATEEFAYPHGVMDRTLPDGTPLDAHFFLQHPGDYLMALEYVVPEIVKHSGVDRESIVGLGVDFTCTVLPVDKNFRPLSEDARFTGRPHAWTKLWKHLGAQSQADRLTQICIEQNRPYLDWYGGKAQPQSIVSKAIEVFEKDREVFDAAYGFVEAADYVNSVLVGHAVFGYTPAAAKGFYDAQAGYPDGKFFAAIDPALRNLPEDKLMWRFTDKKPVSPWEKAGMISPEWAEKLGVSRECIIAGPQFDGYAPMTALGIDKPGIMMMIAGTSTSIMLLNDREIPVEGVMACLPGIFYPDMCCYASGQASVGDGFQWFADNCVPERYVREAEKRGVSVQTYLTSLAEKIEPGTTGLIALDWYNGNKSCLGNGRLSGMFLGLNLSTRPEEIYLAMLEATAFGAKTIIDGYRSNGVPVNEVRVCGGIAGKNSLLMQIYADVFGMPVKVSRCTQAAALGASIYAAAAAGEKTGYNNIFEAVSAMADDEYVIYEPIPGRQKVYQELFGEYMQLHDYFGRGGNRVMERMYERRR